jgi:hypothetical protein
MSLEVFHHNRVVPKESLAAAKTATAEDIHFHYTISGRYTTYIFLNFIVAALCGCRNGIG